MSILTFAFLIVSFCPFPETLAQNPTTDDFPNKHITVVIPFTAGGGTDAFGRFMKMAIQKNALLTSDTNFVIDIF